MDDPFTVVGDYNSVTTLGPLENKFAQPLQGVSVNRLTALTIQSNNLLMVRTGDDSALLDRLKLRIGEYSRGRRADAAQNVENALTGVVFSDDPTGAHPTAQAADIMDDIGGAAETPLFRHHPQHRHRCFRR